MSALRVALVATEGFSPFHFAVPSMVFGKALPEPGRFEMTICALTPRKVQSDSGISIDVAHGLALLETADIVTIPFWHHPDEKPAPVLLSALVRAWQRGAQVVGLCLWAFERDFSRRFPEVQLDSNALYTRDDRLITSAGTAAGIDCCLDIIRCHCGSALANRVVRRMVVPPYRDGGQAQFIERPVPQTTRDTHINTLLDYLRSHLDQPHSLEALAAFVSMSRRTFTRHFIKATGMTVGEWLTAERLQRSQMLLESRDHSVEVVAQMAGFASPISFRQRFKARFNPSPSEWRRACRGPASPA